MQSITSPGVYAITRYLRLGDKQIYEVASTPVCILAGPAFTAVTDSRINIPLKQRYDGGLRMLMTTLQLGTTADDIEQLNGRYSSQEMLERDWRLTFLTACWLQNIGVIDRMANEIQSNKKGTMYYSTPLLKHYSAGANRILREKLSFEDVMQMGGAEIV